MAELSTTKAKEEDFDFAWDIYENTISSTVSEMIRGGWDSASEKLNFDKTWSVEDSHIILLDGKKVGWLSYKMESNSLLINNLYLTKENQKKGIGSILVKAIVDEGRKAGVKSINASVLKNDSVNQFAEKQGFNTSVADESEIVNQVSLTI